MFTSHTPPPPILPLPEILTAKVMVLGGKAFGRVLVQEGSANEISALIKERQETPLDPSTM
jgi:hypothetical protein